MRSHRRPRRSSGAPGWRKCPAWHWAGNTDRRSDARRVARRRRLARNPGERAVRTRRRRGRSSTTKWQSAGSSPARCQDGTSASASRPINQTNGSPPPSSQSESTVYDGPGRTTSKSDASRPASWRVARCSMRHRSITPARGAARCPGRAASNIVICALPSAARARRAACRWPRWTGSKVPPRIAFTLVSRQPSKRRVSASASVQPARRRLEGISAIRREAPTTRMGACGRALRVVAGAPLAALQTLDVPRDSSARVRRKRRGEGRSGDH